MIYLDFENEIQEIDQVLEQLLAEAEPNDSQINNLRKKRQDILSILYKNLTPWQITQVARHTARPGFLDYASKMCSDFIELHGDRLFGDDGAILGGWACIGDHKVMIIGQEKGIDMESRLKRNFGMPNPEGYRKALRLAKMAAKFKKPIVTFVDTPGAYPGIGAEERGQGEAIAKNLLEFFSLEVPVISIIIGEGGSGGALGIAVADKVLMFENSVYSVISPESCASILWHDSAMAQQAAEALKYTAAYLKKFDVIDQIISEPLGGAHRDPDQTIVGLKNILISDLTALNKKTSKKLINERYERFRKLGRFVEK
ncbi:MAG: acetyl-CoA carboxylase carboxyltransferase subunit alpha [Brevinemataceae bacterium]